MRLSLIGLFCLAVLTPAFCQQQAEKKEVRTVIGNIVAVDWVASVVTVRYFDDRPGRGYDEISFVLNEATAITKGTEEIELSELNQGDQVSVDYCDCLLKGLLAVKIVVKI